MKKYETKILILFFLLTLMVGCTPNKNEVVQHTGDVEISKSKNEQSEVRKETDKREEDVEEIVNSTELEDSITSMIKEADYIAKVKLINKGQKTTELKILQNIKGVISSKALPNLDLKKYRAYVVFLKENESGVTLVDGYDSVVLLEGNQHELFKKINKHVYR